MTAARPLLALFTLLAGFIAASCRTIAANPTAYRASGPPFEVSFDRDGELQGAEGDPAAALREVARQIDAFTRAPAGRKTLVVLVHGTSAGVPAYGEMEARIRESYFPMGDAVFVRVYWPGGAFGRDRHPWGYAQHNSYGAGLGLRRLLSALPDDVPVRILTHSMGAGVAAGALWNVVSKVQTSRRLRSDARLLAWRSEYVARLDSFPTPTLRDVRVAMLVPAVPGCTFDDFSRPAPSVDSMNYALRNDHSTLGCGFGLGPDSIRQPVMRPNVRRVIVGYNPNDLVIEKFFRRCSWVGNTCLGSSRNEFAHYVERVRRSGTEVDAVPITTSADAESIEGRFATEAHWFLSYVQHESVRPLFDRLFR